MRVPYRAIQELVAKKKGIGIEKEMQNTDSNGAFTLKCAYCDNFSRYLRILFWNECTLTSEAENLSFPMV